MVVGVAFMIVIGVVVIVIVAAVIVGFAFQWLRGLQGGFGVGIGGVFDGFCGAQDFVPSMMRTTVETDFAAAPCRNRSAKWTPRTRAPSAQPGLGQMGVLSYGMRVGEGGQTGAEVEAKIGLAGNERIHAVSSISHRRF
jgi:hypothetical protein